MPETSIDNDLKQKSDISSRMLPIREKTKILYWIQHERNRYCEVEEIPGKTRSPIHQVKKNNCNKEFCLFYYATSNNA